MTGIGIAAVFIAIDFQKKTVNETFRRKCAPNEAKQNKK